MKRILTIILSMFLCAGTVCANEWANDNSVIRASVTYKDITTGFWGYDAVMNATRLGWFSGYTDGTFKPDDTITRAEAAKAVSCLLKLRTVKPVISSYSDVDTNSWYSEYVEAAKELFYPKYGNEFRPSMSITRDDALYLLVKAYGYDTLSESVDLSVLNVFSDNSFVTADMRKITAVGLHYGLMAGFSDNTLRPGAVLTRAQFATMLDRLYSIGPNNVPTKAMLESIELVTESTVSVGINEKFEVTAYALYSDGTMLDYTKNLNPYTEDTDVLRIIENRVYGIARGKGVVLFNNPDLSGKQITVSVNE